MNGWIMTDDGSMQHVRHLFGRVYEMVDSFDCIDHFCVCHRVIDLNDYEMNGEFCTVYLEPYGYSDENSVINLYGDMADQIIFECICETEIWEKECTIYSGTQDECIALIQSIVGGEN